MPYTNTHDHMIMLNPSVDDAYSSNPVEQHESYFFLSIDIMSNTAILVLVVLCWSYSHSLFIYIPINKNTDYPMRTNIPMFLIQIQGDESNGLLIIYLFACFRLNFKGDL